MYRGRIVGSRLSCALLGRRNNISQNARLSFLSPTLPEKLSFWLHRGDSSTKNAANVPSLTFLSSTRGFTSNVNLGEKCYNDALEALKKVEEIREETERRKSEEMYKAWQKADEKQKQHEDNPKAENLKGVAVVKTIVKQTRKERKTPKQEAEHWKSESERLLKEAALTHGHPQSLILLGNDELKKANVSYDKELVDMESAKESVESALSLYQKAGKNGSAEGWFNFGQLLWTGYPAVEIDESDMTHDIVLQPDKQESMEAFRKAIDLGDPDAMYFVGVHLLSADDESDNMSTEVQKQLQEGLELVQTSADIGHGPARYYLALLYLNGNDVLGIAPCSSEEFVRLLNSAAEAGDADALFLRGHSYHEGDNGYPQDYRLALADFVGAAEAGNSDAAVSAGAVLHSGRPGVKQNQAHAFEFYQLAGEMGSLEGWRNVAACYALGEGCTKSDTTAKYIINTMLKEESS